MPIIDALHTALRRALLCASGALLLASAPAHAQYINPMAVPGITLPVVLNPCPGGKCVGVSQGQGRSRDDAAVSAKLRAGATLLTFTPSAARRKENLARIVAGSNNDPAMQELAAQATQIFPQLKAVGQAATTGARRMGVDLSTMTLTAQGFQGAGTGAGTR